MSYLSLALRFPFLMSVQGVGDVVDLMPPTEASRNLITPCVLSIAMLPALCWSTRCWARILFVLFFQVLAFLCSPELKIKFTFEAMLVFIE